ncbi:MAG: zinc-ribbon domain-containing protein, partial [Promethearchaeota archaeon]
MFCTNCGEKLLEQEQKFCQKCGAIIKTTSTISYSGSQQTILNTQSKSQILQKSDKIPQNPLATGEVGPHSKRSLVFG